MWCVTKKGEAAKEEKKKEESQKKKKKDWKNGLLLLLLLLLLERCQTHERGGNVNEEDPNRSNPFDKKVCLSFWDL